MTWQNWPILFKSDKLNNVTGDCDNGIVLLEHANKQINITSKDCLNPKLNKEYSHLFSHYRILTQLFFGAMFQN